MSDHHELAEAMRLTADSVDSAGDVLGDRPEQFEHVLMVMAARDSLRELSRLTSESSRAMNDLLPDEYREGGQ